MLSRFAFNSSRLPYLTPNFHHYTLQTPYGRIAYEIIEGNACLEVILFCHGRDSNIESNHDNVVELARKGKRTVISWDYPGYGNSSGIATAESCREVLKTLVDTFRPGILIGNSIGCGVILDFLSYYNENNLSLVILINPFLSALKFYFKDYPIASYLSSSVDFFNNENNIQQVKDTPLKIFVSKENELVPPEHGRILARIADCRIHELEGGHKEAFETFIKSLDAIYFLV